MCFGAAGADYEGRPVGIVADGEVAEQVLGRRLRACRQAGGLDAHSVLLFAATLRYATLREVKSSQVNGKARPVASSQ